MEFLFELTWAVLQVFLELFLQLFVELLAEFGIRSVREPFRPKPRSPWLAGVGYALFGILAGILSLLIFPALFVHSPGLRWLNLLVSPLCAGLLMGLIGARKLRQGRETIRLESFLYGWIFAFAMAVVRFGWGH